MNSEGYAEDSGFDDDSGDAALAQTVARTTQEEEDAAMAKRLQEELYAENATTADGIRAPIERTTETLVAPSGYGIPSLDDDAMDEASMEDAIVEQLRRRRQPRRKSSAAPCSWADTLTRDCH